MKNRNQRPRTRFAVLATLVAILLWGTTLAGSRCQRPPTTVEGVTGPRSDAGRNVDPLSRPNSTSPVSEGLVGAEDGDSRIAIEDPPTADPSPSSCQITGRVVDPQGAPLAGAEVSLAGLRNWSPTAEVEALEGWESAWKGWTTKADRDGSFAFEVPPPTVERTMLRVRNGRRWTQVRMEFGPGTRELRPPFHPGFRNLGEISLRPARWIVGRVTTPDGEPVAGASVRIRHNSTTAPPRVYTDDDGFYELESIALLHPLAVPKTWNLEADCRGYREAEVRGLVIDEGSTPARQDLLLVPMFEIRGRVLDSEGQPVRRCKVIASANSAPRRANASTEADGRYVLYLEEEGEYVLRASHEGLESQESSPTPTGSLAEDLILEPPSPIRFHIRRAENGAPVEAFTARVARGAVTHDKDLEYFRISVKYRDETHPGGTIDLQADPEEDLIEVAAPGFIPYFNYIEPEPGDPPTQVIELLEGAKVRGRWVSGDASPRPLRVRIEDGVWSPSGATPEEPRRFTTTVRTHDPIVESDDTGRFEFSGLRPGLYRVTTVDEFGVQSSSEPFDLGLSEVHELGDLSLARGGVLEGVVLLPEAWGGEAVPLGLGPWRSSKGPSPRTEPDGRFRIEHLTPGTYEVWPRGVPERTAPGAREIVQVRDGETTRVTLDVRGTELCRVHLWIVADGLRDTEVWPRSDSGQNLLDDPWRPNEFGRIEKSLAPRSDAVGFWCRFDAGTRSHVFREQTSLPPGGHVDLTLEIPRGSITVEVPDPPPLVDGTEHALSIQPTESAPGVPEHSSYYLRVKVVDGVLESGTTTWSVDGTGQRWTASFLDPGEYEVSWVARKPVVLGPDMGPGQRGPKIGARGPTRVVIGEGTRITLSP